MRRIVLALAFLLCFGVSAFAAHFNCTTTANCSAASLAPCDWASAATWSSCNSTYPNNTGGNTYTATISAGASVNLATDGLAIGLATQANPGLTVNGALTFSEATTGRDANNYRTLTVIPNNAGATTGTAISIGTAGIVKGTAGNRIFFDTSSGNRARITLSGGSTWDFQGDVATTYLDAVAAITSNTTYCDSAGVNQYYVVTLHDQAPQAKAGRRIVFQGGQMVNRQFEIVSVAGRKVGFCTDRLDSMSANDECTAASTPYACCSGTKAGTCTLGQRLTPHRSFGNYTTPHHWTPAETPGDAICTAAVTPRPYCTGNAAGTGFTIAPAVNDAVAIVDDVWLMQSAGTIGWDLTMTNAAQSLHASATNAGGGIGIGGSASGTGTEPSWPVEFVNLHEMPSTTSGISFTGFVAGPPLRWNAVHDEVATSGGNGGAILFSNFSPTACPCVADSEIAHNIVYRTLGNGINVNGSNSTVASQRIQVHDNIVMEGCTNNGAECNAIEVNDCQYCRVSDNLVYDWVISTGPSQQYGACFRAGSASNTPVNSFQGTVFNDNIAVDCGKTGFQFDGTNNGAETVTATHNYISNTYSEGAGFSGRYFDNVIRNWDMGKNLKGGIFMPVLAKGNFLIHFDDAVYTSLCGGASCYGKGIESGKDATYLTDDPPLVFSDNIVTRPGDNFANGFSFTGNAKGGITLDHTTVDGGGLSAVGVDFVPSDGAWAPGIPTAAAVTNTAVTHIGNSSAFRCSTNLNALATLGTWIGTRSSITAETVNSNSPILNNSSCALTGATRFDATLSATGGVGIGFLNRVNEDYNLSTGAPALTAGTNGTALGSRAFRFDRDRLNQHWGYGFPFELSAGDATGATVPPFPRNVSNGQANTDTDGDGVMDFLDNCPTTWNPSQYDSDSNGKGCACDAAERTSLGITVCY